VPGLIPVDRLHHVTVVVRDLRETARNYALVYGIHRWEVVHHTPERLRETSAFGYEASFGYAAATGSNAHGVTFRLVQPTGGLSSFAEFLVTRDEGIHGMCLASVSETDLRALGDRLPALQAAVVDGARHCWLDTRSALGGFSVEVVAPAGSGPDGRPPDERWDFGAELARPTGAEQLWELPRVWHFGVAVGDLMGRLPAYAELLGLTEWTFLHFRPEPGSLERSTLEGEEVRNAWLLALASTGEVAFEALQPTMEPTPFRRHMLDPLGEGIHHLQVLPSLGRDDWAPVERWMASMDVPVATSGLARYGAVEFFYLDTRRLLGGYLLEAICRQQPPAQGGPPRGAPDFRFDFSRRAAPFG
jgi:Glyoxalase/Bleomycin resistance protein/Dioxygenase superfamily